MDLSKIVQENNKEQKEQLNLDALKKKTINEFEKFLETSEDLCNLSQKKALELKNQIKNDLDKYLTNSGFEKENGTHINKDGSVAFTGSIFYKNGNTEIELIPLESDDELLADYNIIIRPNGIYNSIILKPQEKDSSKLIWKKMIKYKNDCLHIGNYKEFVNKINDIKILNNMINDIKTNNAHYIDTINNFNNIEYRYSLYKDDKEYQTIDEVINAI